MVLDSLWLKPVNSRTFYVISRLYVANLKSPKFSGNFFKSFSGQSNSWNIFSVVIRLQLQVFYFRLEWFLGPKAFSASTSGLYDSI